MELRGSQVIAGEDCYAVHVVYRGKPPAESTWYFSKKDFLPRARWRDFTLDNGEKGGQLMTLSKVVVEPELDPEVFALKVPEGYRQTDEPAPKADRPPPRSGAAALSKPLREPPSRPHA